MLTDDEIFKLAEGALRKMLKEHGPNYTFPPDVIWMNIPDGVDVPSKARSHQPKRLINAGLLELTGGLAKAQSKQGSGSVRREHRFGPVLVERPAAATAPSTPSTTPISRGDEMDRLQEAMDAQGYLISTVELANFTLAMMVSPLVILSGISGTGKSQLPRKFASLTKSHFRAIPVQPQWSDNSDMFGYVPTLAQSTFVKGALVDSLLEAKKNPARLVVALLDEMNLAPVEHYFSDFLSIAETRTRNGAHIESDPLPIELPAVPSLGGGDDYSEMRGLHLPSNLRVIGTANMDETTHTFSPKVLDRAFAIEFDDPDLTSFATGSASVAATFEELAAAIINESNPITVREAWARSQDIFEHVADLLSSVQDILAPAGIKIGYRTRDSILMYLHFWRELNLSGIMAGYAALDFCLLQKVLPKIAGSGEALSDALQNLVGWIKARAETTAPDGSVEALFVGPLERSLQKLTRMNQILTLDGATRYWGA